MNFNLSEWAIRNRSLVAYLMLAAVLFGVVSYFRLGRSEDPAFTVKTMVVQARWPGATIDETLKQVTERLERKLQETPNLDYLRSYTVAGQSTIFVNLQGVTPARAVPDIWYQVRKKIADIQPTLPQGVIGPGFNDEFGDTYGIVYGFVADGFTHRELKDYVEDVRSRLLQTPDVSKIDVLGAQDERIYIEFSTTKVAGLGLSPPALLAALQAQNAVTPAGIVQSGDEKILVRVSGAFHSEQDLLAVNFVANGRLIRLGDIAHVIRGYADPPQPMFRVNGAPAIGLAIAMRDGGDIQTLGRHIETAMATIKANLPIGVEPILVAFQPAIVDRAIAEFMESLWEAVAIVLLVSFISLGLRAGAVVALSIPLVLAIVFGAMAIFGIDLQRVSLGALIIALGLLVDDAMITVEMMVKRLEAGDDKERAATYAYTSTAFPMLTGTLVTIAGFVPIGYARSAAGEYTYSIFAVVGLALIASWFVAVVFSPLLGVWILQKPAHVRSEASRPLLQRFKSVLTLAMRWRWLTIAATFGLFALALAGLRYVPQQFFPASDRPELLVDLKLPENADIEASMDVSSRVDKLLTGDPDIDHWSTYVGEGAVRFYLPLNVQLPNDFFSQLVVVAKDEAARERVRARLQNALATDFPNVVARVAPLELGPPVGWPLQYRVSGPDPEKVRDLAMQVAGLMGADARIEKINYDWFEPGRTLRIKINQDQTRLLGLSSQDVAQALNGVVSGMTITQVRDDIYLVNVVTRAVDGQRGSLSTLRNLQIANPTGRPIALSQFATFDYGLELPLIWRRDRVPTLTVQADIAGTALPATMVRDMGEKIADFRAKLPEGYGIEVGGAVEESGKAQYSVLVVVPFMIFLILTILMIQLRSFNALALVISVTPLGLIGVVAALLVGGKPLGFVAILGVLSLVGMIARNSVILIDQVRIEREKGRSIWDSVVEATLHRFRPILLTAAAAILGMLPIASTVFWGPMAYAIMGGLAVATALTLIFLPALYVAWYRAPAPKG